MVLLVLLVCVTWFLAGALVALAVGQAARKEQPRPLKVHNLHLAERQEFEDWLDGVRPNLPEGMKRDSELKMPR